MHRRDFLWSVTAAGSGSSALGVQQADRVLSSPADKLKIAAVEIWQVEGHHPPGLRSSQETVNPLDIYEEYRPKPRPSRAARENSSPVAAKAVYLKIKTDAGLEGFYGPIDKEIASVIAGQLTKLLVGKNPLAGEALWDQMFRSNRHSRHGYFLMAISAVDNALWDLRGRYYNVPVYRLLGGPTRPAVEAYASCAGFSHEPDALRSQSAALKDAGYRYEKWFLAHGPGDGPEGMTKNVELVRILREAVGDEVELMFDSFQSWDLSYAIEWAKRVERYHPYWMEESFPADKIDMFAQLRRSTSVPVASGEHIYNRWEAHEYLRAGALSVLQSDPEWCGGVSELVKICAIASVYDVHVIPHGHSLHAALHVVASQSPATCPLVEYLIGKMSTYYSFEKDPLRVERGKIALPGRPGFGIELDPAKVEKQTRLEWS
jgi:L-alanine-DL-glutamate epimerase-like enolase superfamily enzyme